MALFVDLEEEDSEPPQDLRPGRPVRHDDGAAAAGPNGGEKRPSSAREDPNLSTTTRALGCYPYVSKSTAQDPWDAIAGF
jgi:hypothetical protein